LLANILQSGVEAYSYAFPLLSL